jgi:hypothetical protein
MAKAKPDKTQEALAAIHGLEFSDCIRFFDALATKEEREKAELVDADNDGDVERDNHIISEGKDNGCYVLVWRWASFAGTKFDKEEDE